MEGFTKQIILDTQSDKGIFLYNLDASVDSGYLTKTAAELHPEVAQYIRTAQAIPGKLQILVTALGAMEFYGSNSNGDAFPEDALKHEGTDYGFKTFETMARVFKHHINKKDSPSYGEVRLSVWNDRMKRVELVLLLDRNLAPDLCNRIDNGEYLPLSMGCHVPFDVCSCCGNKAKSRKEYCEHLKFFMNKIPPGYTRRAMAINDFPKFFDISFVIIGADSIAKVMRKVAQVVSSADTTQPPTDASYDYPLPQDRLRRPGAGAGSPGVGKLASALAKAAVLGKSADMDKEVPGNLTPAVAVPDIVKHRARALEVSAHHLRRGEPAMPRRVLIMVAHNASPNVTGLPRLSRILSTLMGMGIVPHRQEFQDLALHSLGHGQLAEDLYNRGVVLPLNAPSGVPARTLEEIEDAIEAQLHISPEHFDPAMYELFAPHAGDRSYLAPVLLQRLRRGPTPAFAPQVKEASIGPVGMMALMASLFAAYASKNPAAAATGFERLVASHPALAAAVGVGAVMATKAALKPRMVGNYDADPRTGRASQPLSLGEYIARQNQVPYADNSPVKTAGLGGRIFVGVPAIYMASGMQEYRQARNPDGEGFIGKTVRENPDLLATGLVAEGALGAPVTKRLQALGQGGLNLLKRASVSDTLDLSTASSSAHGALDSAILDEAAKWL